MLGVPLTRINCAGEFLEIVKHPRYGYGKNLNPCLDCRILLLRKAGELMREVRALFVATGEVLGERPMSQHREQLLLTEKRADLQRLVLRPLSAKLMEPTIPEEQGIVDREKLLDISGRSRKPQMGLAAKFGIKEYPSPAGGCLLTDPAFSQRLADLMKERPDFDLNDAELLRAGRHFRLAPAGRVVVGRDHQDNLVIQSLARSGDFVLLAAHVSGPLTLCRGAFDESSLRKAAAITARYGKGRTQPEVEVVCEDVSKRKTKDGLGGCYSPQRREGRKEEHGNLVTTEETPFLALFASSRLIWPSLRVRPREPADVGAERIG